MAPAVSSSRKSKRPQKTCVSNNNGNEGTWSSFYAPEPGKQSPRKRRKVREHSLSNVYAPQGSYIEPTDEDAFLDPSLGSQSSHHDHDRPFGSSASTYDILPTEAAVGISNGYSQSFQVPNGWDRSAGFGSVTQAMGPLIHPWYNGQPTVQAAPRGMTHPPLGVEYTSIDTGIVPGPWDNGPHILAAAQYQSTCRSFGVEDTLDSNFGVNFAQQRSLEEDVERCFLSTGLRSRANQMFPIRDYPRSGIDYRNVRPRGEEDRREIQSALAKTKFDFSIRTGNECPPTDTSQSYSYQVRQVLDEFAMWAILGSLFPIPDLIKCQAPWRSSFADWEAPTGGDQELVIERLQGLTAHCESL